MKHITITITAAAVMLGASVAAHAGSGNPGHKGTVAAYSPITDVYDSERCPRTKYSWDYVSCGKALRERVKERMCQTRGKGTHKYFYQIGNGRKTTSSVYCKSGGGGGGDHGGGDDGGGDDDGGGGDDGGDTGNGRAGHRGSVAGWFPDRSDLFDSQRCYKKGLGYDYSACGSILRARIKRRICKMRGKGTHTWYYQIGDNTKSRSSVYCKH